MLRHYVEMVGAMFAGMLLLDPLWPTGDKPVEVKALAMATNMCLGMAVLMRFRCHAWSGIAVMSSAMYLPLLALFLPYWNGLIEEGSVLDLGHLLMLAQMFLLVRQQSLAERRRGPSTFQSAPTAAQSTRESG